MYGFNKGEIKLFKSLNTPRKIQDFIDKIPINFEPTGDSFLSPREVLKQNRAHCIEGACLAAAILRFHGYKPLILDLTSYRYDEDHIITPFQIDGFWGAISKTNHGILRYREPIYQSVRELVMTFFHEYIKNETKSKTLRSYTKPIDLSQFDEKGWTTDENDLWYIVDHIFKTPHINILTKKQIANLRKADDIEIKSSEITEWKHRVSLNHCEK